MLFSSYAIGQTNEQTDILISVLCTPRGGEVTNYFQHIHRAEEGGHREESANGH